MELTNFKDILTSHFAKDFRNVRFDFKARALLTHGANEGTTGVTGIWKMFKEHECTEYLEVKERGPKKPVSFTMSI